MQPKMNQIKRNIVIIKVASTLKHTPQLASTVSAVESGIKHINVLKWNIETEEIIFYGILIYIAISSESPTNAKPQIPATII